MNIFLKSKIRHLYRLAFVYTCKSRTTCWILCSRTTKNPSIRNKIIQNHLWHCLHRLHHKWCCIRPHQTEIGPVAKSHKQCQEEVKMAWWLHKSWKSFYYHSTSYYLRKKRQQTEGGWADYVTEWTGRSFRNSDISTQTETYGGSWSSAQLCSDLLMTPGHHPDKIILVSNI